MRRGLWPAWLVAALLVVACAEPPHKEMDQAQGAIDAAKAAGADQYAAEEYRAAVDALKQSNDAAALRDYRLALNHALDSRERATNAARLAADTKAQLRADVERTLATVATPLADAHTRLAAAEKVRAGRRLLREPSAALVAIDADVQKAGEALKMGDYKAAQASLKDVKERIAQTTAAIKAAVEPPRARRTR